MPHRPEVLAGSAFRIEAGAYAYCRVRRWPENPHQFVAADDRETTVVTQENRIGELDLVERHPESFALVRLQVAVPFDSVGFLAAITGALAAEGMNVLVVSTYSMDYLLVGSERRRQARDALLRLGLRELPPH